jgi:hypothetical protein
MIVAAPPHGGLVKWRAVLQWVPSSDSGTQLVLQSYSFPFTFEPLPAKRCLGLGWFQFSNRQAVEQKSLPSRLMLNFAPQ